MVVAAGGPDTGPALAHVEARRKLRDAAAA
jgi:hypothetical protein